MSQSIDESATTTMDNNTKSLLGTSYMNTSSWICARAGLRRSATCTLKKIEQSPISDLVEAQAYEDKLVTLRGKLSSLDDSIRDYMLGKGLWTDDEYQSEYTICEGYQDGLTLGIRRLQLVIKNLQTANAPILHSNPPAPMPNAGQSFNPKMSLPKLELPTFDGKPEYYTRFILQFESIMDKFTLTPFQKFTYLEGQLSGPAKDLIKSISDDDLRYDVARDLLDKAFKNEDTQKFAVLERIINLHMEEQEPFKWISELRMIKNQVDKLKIDAAFFLQFFAWRSLSENYKRQIIAISHKSRPSLDEILNSAFEANVRLNDVAKPSEIVAKVPAPTIAFASTLPENKAVKSAPPSRVIKCSLCAQEGKHRTKDCPKYPTSQAKNKRIKQLKLCLKCGWNHETSKCRRVTFPCKYCREMHFEYLCEEKPKAESSSKTEASSKAEKKSPSESSSKNETAASSVICGANLLSGRNSFLPTFTANLSGNSRMHKKVRAAYDSWSQTTFINEKIAQNLQCKILDPNYELLVKGFNSSRTIFTKIVEISIQVGSTTHRIPAVTIPDFAMKLQITDAKEIAKLFQDKGLSLADRNLIHGNQNDINLLLGSDNAGILPVSSVVVKAGNDETLLSYLNSPLGVMLQGNAAKFLENPDSIKSHAQL